MPIIRFCKYIYGFFCDEYGGQTVYYENETTRLRPEEAIANAAKAAEMIGWTVNRNGTVVAPNSFPELMKLWRTDDLVWRVRFEYTHIAGNDLGDFRRETLGCILIDDKTGKFIKAKEESRFHQDPINGAMTELDALEFARSFVEKEGWQWHEPATAQIYGDNRWLIRADTLFADAWIYLEFDAMTKRIYKKSYRPRGENGARMSREQAREIARQTATDKKWAFFEPLCADFQNGIWDIHLPPLKDYSASVKIDDRSGKVVAVDFWSGLAGKSLREKYE